MGYKKSNFSVLERVFWRSQYWVIVLIRLLLALFPFSLALKLVYGSKPPALPLSPPVPPEMPSPVSFYPPNIRRDLQLRAPQNRKEPPKISCFLALQNRIFPPRLIGNDGGPPRSLSTLSCSPLLQVPLSSSCSFFSRVLQYDLVSVAEDKGPRRTLVSPPPDMPMFVRRRGQARSTPPDFATLRPVPDVTSSAAKRRLLCGDPGHSSPSSVVASASLPSHKPRRLLLIWPLSPVPKGRPCSSAKLGRSGARSQKAHVSCLLAGARPRSVRCRDSETFALVRL